MAILLAWFFSLKSILYGLIFWVVLILPSKKTYRFGKIGWGFLKYLPTPFFGVLVTILLTSGCSSCVWLWLISINFLFMFPRSATFLWVLSMLKRQNKMYVQLFIHTNKHTKLAFYNSGNNIMKQGDILVWIWFVTSKARLNFNLSHGLPDNLRLKNIRNWEVFQKPQSWLEAELSAQSL